jgi:hypothetical protein
LPSKKKVISKFEMSLTLPKVNIGLEVHIGKYVEIMYFSNYIALKIMAKEPVHWL